MSNDEQGTQFDMAALRARATNHPTDWRAVPCARVGCEHQYRRHVRPADQPRGCDGCACDGWVDPQNEHWPTPQKWGDEIVTELLTALTRAQEENAGLRERVSVLEGVALLVDRAFHPEEWPYPFNEMLIPVDCAAALRMVREAVAALSTPSATEKTS